MNINDGLFIRSILLDAARNKHLKITDLAKTHSMGVRRMTNYVLCMEKAGLLYIHVDGSVQPSTTLDVLHRLHVAVLASLSASELSAPRYSGWLDDVRAKQMELPKLPPDVCANILNEMFGSPKKKGRKQ